MRIGYVTADHGIPVFGEKGASIHVQSLQGPDGALYVSDDYTGAVYRIEYVGS